MSDVLLFGAHSMLGWSILERGQVPGLTAFCTGLTRSPPPNIGGRLKLSDEAAVRALFRRVRPRLILAFAGICNVEKCETSPEFAREVNIGGAHNLLEYAPPRARIVYGSSDHVFGGSDSPYYEDSPVAPISVFGRTRVEAERMMLARPNTLVIRPGLWIGPSFNGRIGHLDWLRSRHARGLPMTVISDEIRSAVWAEAAARRVVALARSRITGIRHLSATRAVARPTLARYLTRRFEINATIDVKPGSSRPVPHLGRVELGTRYTDRLAAPLSAVVPPGFRESAGHPQRAD